MARKRRKLLDTGKRAGKSIAGTLSSIAGTIESKTGLAKQRATDAVVDRYQSLTDDTVTDQEQARLQRARQEAQQEARQEARREFQEEFRENVFDEAYQAELESLQRTGRGQDSTVGKIVSAGQRVADSQAAQPQGGGQGMAVNLFGGPPQQNRTGSSQTREQSPIEAQQGSPLGVFGVPNDPRDTDPTFYDHEGVETLFGVNSGGKDKRRQVDPLFGFRF